MLLNRSVTLTVCLFELKRHTYIAYLYDQKIPCWGTLWEICIFPKAKEQLLNVFHTWHTCCKTNLASFFFSETFWDWRVEAEVLVTVWEMSWFGERSKDWTPSASRISIIHEGIRDLCPAKSLLFMELLQHYASEDIISGAVINVSTPTGWWKWQSTDKIDQCTSLFEDIVLVLPFIRNARDWVYKENVCMNVALKLWKLQIRFSQRNRLKDNAIINLPFIFKYPHAVI